MVNSDHPSCWMVIMFPAEFPWDALAPGASVCDVGSGVGAVMESLATRHPHIHVTLQDLPVVIDRARAVSRFPTCLPLTLCTLMRLSSTDSWRMRTFSKTIVSTLSCLIFSRNRRSKARTFILCARFFSRVHDAMANQRIDPTSASQLE